MMNPIQIPSVVYNVSHLVPQAAATRFAIVQPPTDSLMYYSVPTIKLLVPRVQEQIPAASLNIAPSVAPQEQKPTDEWTPILGSTFIIPELINGTVKAETVLGLTNLAPTINPANVQVKKCSCETVYNEYIYNASHEGTVSLCTTGGDMNALNDPYLPEWKRKINLEEISLKSFISRVDIKIGENSSFVTSSSYIGSLTRAVNDILTTGVFKDWLLLKCEATKVDFSSLREEVSIHSVNSFNGVLNAVQSHTCLPLPFTMRKNNSYLYYYFVFNSGGNPKIPKVNYSLFCELFITSEVPNNETCGIQVSDTYIPKLNEYTFYADKGLSLFIKQNEVAIKKLILHHIVWGYLQGWVRKMAKLYKCSLTVEEIAKQLTLCRVNSEKAQDLKEAANRCNSLYLLGFCETYFLYLIYFSLDRVHKMEYSISVTNIETDFVSEIPVIQYFRQYFFVNLPNQKGVVQEVVETTGTSKEVLESGVFSLARGEQTTVDDKSERGKSGSSVKSFEREGRKLRKINSSKNSKVKSPLKTGRVEEVKPKVKSPAKPLLKTRTVEEINSAVDQKLTSRKSAESSDDKERNAIMCLLGKGELGSFRFESKVGEYLNEIYQNTTGLIRKDESKDPALIQECFNEAMSLAEKTKGLKVFLSQVYNHLQLYFTNSTCKNIMNAMVLERLSFGITTVWREKLRHIDPKLFPGDFNSTNNRVEENLFSYPKLKEEIARFYRESSDVTKAAHLIRPCFVRLDRREVDDYFKRWKKENQTLKSPRKPNEEPVEDKKSRMRGQVSDEEDKGNQQDVANTAAFSKACLRLTRVENLVVKCENADSVLEGMCDIPRIDKENATRILVVEKNPKRLGRSSVNHLEVDFETSALLFNWKNKRRKIQ